MILGRTPEGSIKIKTDSPGLRAVECACCESERFAAPLSSELAEIVKNATSVRVQMSIYWIEVFGDCTQGNFNDNVDITSGWDGVGKSIVVCPAPNFCYGLVTNDPSFADQGYTFRIGLNKNNLQFAFRQDFLYDQGCPLGQGTIINSNQIDEFGNVPYVFPPDSYVGQPVIPFFVNGFELKGCVDYYMTTLIDFQACEDQGFIDCINYTPMRTNASVSLTFE
jgi:hypothetical protein